MDLPLVMTWGDRAAQVPLAPLGGHGSSWGGPRWGAPFVWVRVRRRGGLCGCDRPAPQWVCTQAPLSLGASAAPRAAWRKWAFAHVLACAWGVRGVCERVHAPAPRAPHGRPRLVPPTRPRCARRVSVARGDVCSDAHSPLPGPGALVFSSVRKGHPEKEVAGSGEGSLLEPPSGP